MSRKKKRIDQPSETAASHHRNFTMISTSETPQYDTTPRPGMTADDYYASPAGGGVRDHPEAAGAYGGGPPPYQHGATTVDRVPPDSPSETDSEADLEKGRRKGGEGKPGCCATLTRVLFIFLLVLLLIVGLFCLAMGVAIEISPDLTSNDSISFLGLAAIIQGITSLVIFIFGVSSSHSRRKAPYIIFMLLLLATGALQIYGTLQAEKKIQALQDSISGTWDGLNDPHRIWLQKTLNCCGFDDDNDRPGSVCPPSPSGGCQAQLDDWGGKVHDNIFKAMYAAIGLDVLLFLLALILLITSTRKKKQ